MHQQSLNQCLINAIPANYVSLVKGGKEGLQVNMNKHKICQAFTQQTLKCPKYIKEMLNPIQAGVFCYYIGWGGTLCPSVSPVFVVQLPPNLA